MFNPLDGLSAMDAVRRIVAAGQCALPLMPPPTSAEIDNVLKRLQTAFEFPISYRIEAEREWNSRVQPLRDEAAR
jgi:hypothetical protein